MASLYRAAIPGLVETKCSAASFFGNRVSVRSNGSDTHLYVASGKSVHSVSLAAPNIVESTSSDQPVTKEPPGPINVDCNATLLDTGVSEIHSLFWAKSHSEPDAAGVLYSTDAKGRVVLRRLNTDGSVDTSIQANPTNLLVDTGFSGIAVDPFSTQKFAVARFADNSVSLFDGDKVVRTFHTIHRPTGIIHLGASHPNLMAIAEWAQISIWDDRVSEKSGYTLRVTPGTEPIFALCAGNPGNPGQKHLFAYGGAARTVTIFDIEKMSNIGHWTGSLKYDILYLNFAAKHSNHVFATGFDSEVVCGDWETSGADRFDGLRVESRWIGHRIQEKHDSLVGVTEDGFAYIFRNASSLVVPSGKFDKKRQLLTTSPAGKNSNPKRQKKDEKPAEQTTQPPQDAMAVDPMTQ